MRPQIGVQRGAGTGGQDRLYVSTWNCIIKVRASQAARGGCSGGGGERRIYVARSDNAGLTWSNAILVSAANVRSGGAIAEAGSADEQAREPSQPIVGPDGTIYVAYRNRDITNGVTCPNNPDAPPLTPAPPAAGFPSNLQACVVVSRSTNGGATWTQTSTGFPVYPNTLTNPRLAIDPTTPAGTGTLYVVYQQRIGLTDPSDITLQRSTDGGVTWGSQVRVNDDPAGGTQTNPYVAVGPTGIVHVIWSDKRHRYPGAANYGDTYYARSTDGGLTIQPNRRMTDRTINFDVGRSGDLGSGGTPGFSWFGPVALALPNGAVLGEWQDSRLGDSDNGIQDNLMSRLEPGLEIGANTTRTATPPGLSVKLSGIAYPGGTEAVGGDPVTKVVVVNDADRPAALAASVLARANFGPLLLSPQGGLPAIVKAEAARLRPVGGYVIGDGAALSGQVSSDLRATTRSGENVTRIAAPASVALNNRPADIARQIAELLDPPAAPEAVIVDPSSTEAAAGAALAASLRLPMLFVDGRTGNTPVPPPTLAALSSLGIPRVLIVGGTQAVTATVETQLVGLLGGGNVRRLNGADQYATSELAVAEAIARGLPKNVVYVSDGLRPMDSAVLGAAVGRLGGLSLLTPQASTAVAQARLGALGLDPTVDRVAAVSSTGGADPTLPLLGVATPPAGLPVTPPAAAGVVTPAVTNLKVSPAAFRAARSGASVRSSAGRPGTRVSYRLNVAATVRFGIERKASGRRVGGRCVATTSANRGRASCVRYTRVAGSFSRTRAAGNDSFTFTGRFAGRTLRRASYRLLATPRANGRTGTTKRAAFRISS